MSIADESFWSDLFGSLAADCGFSPAQVREMTLHDVYRIRAHFADRPSLRTLAEEIAAALGVKFERPDAERKPMSYHEAAMFFRATGGRIEGLITDG